MAAINGTAGNDVITGTAEDDVIDGGAGNDRINGGAGNDIIFGGDGNDTLTGDAGNDILHGGNGNDGFFGGGGDDTIYGDAGDDVMYGDAGNDTLYGGSGFNTLIGGAGNDTMVLELSAATLTDGMRADLATLKGWMADQLAAAGSLNALYAQTSGPSLTLSSLGVTLSLVENVKILLDGVETPIDTFLNHAPTAAGAVALATQEDTPVAGRVVATDADGDALRYATSQGPAHGTLVLDAASGAYVYTPGSNFSGTDAFTVQVADGRGGTVSQTVSVGVAAVADAPDLVTRDQTIALSGSVLIGTKAGETMVAAAGETHILGGAGDDTIVAADPDRVTVALDIAASLHDVDGSETLAVAISGVPSNAYLSAGQLLDSGSWQLTAGDLAGLTITASTVTDLNLHVTATAAEASGDVASVSHDLSIVFDRTAAPSIIEGGSGSDNITGGAGGDTIYGSSAPSGAIKAPSVASEKDNDVIHGGDGDDTIYGQNGNDQLFGDNGNDFLSGGKGDDLLYGGSGHNVINGNSGDDTIFAQGGDDTISGGTGFDTLDFSASTHGLSIDVSTHTATGFGTVSFTGIEQIIGSSHGDTYKGSSGADIFVGGDGDDVIRGLGGADTLTGGGGNDTFVYLKKDADALDHITDFSVGDKLDLHDFLKSAKYTSIDSVVQVTDNSAGSLVSVKVGVSFVDVVMLDGVHGTTAHDMLAHGMILT